MAPVFTDRSEVIFGKEKLVEKMNNRYLREGWK
jgi:NADH-quinone oxidoreductase subunit I